MGYLVIDYPEPYELDRGNPTVDAQEVGYMAVRRLPGYITPQWHGGGRLRSAPVCRYFTVDYSHIAPLRSINSYLHLLMAASQA